ncbi:type VI secretion system-associated protein TagF [Xanthomonas cerealis pv. cerealis]|uniref:Type VI secretion system-associated protein TagF n=1 Tax=Xanthomonas cerealis pv. cerealis TaxID=152263 RepID=A0A514EDH9_9XANT|nr:type VI secretion system-associated protein TagF [Xanthomonas translucens]QDI04108.1 type VI secretion system-associated protein TagF [Xanthomonas translucens pv. cerealis]
MTSLHAHPGFHGKLPCAGDFVLRRLPTAFVEPWDTAMQHLQRQVRAQAPAAQAWNFVLAPGLCGACAWAGALVASRDRVGRRFPLTIAAALPLGACHPHWLGAAAALLESAAAMDDVDSFDRACQALAATAMAPTAQWPPPPRAGALWWSSRDHGHSGVWVATDGLPGPQQAAMLLGQGEAASEPVR